MYPGVGKSGSPAPKPMTGLPAALSALALASTASVAASEMAELRAETLVDMSSIVPPATGAGHAIYLGLPWPASRCLPHAARLRRLPHAGRLPHGACLT